MFPLLFIIDSRTAPAACLSIREFLSSSHSAHESDRFPGRILNGLQQRDITPTEPYCDGGTRNQ